MKESTSSNAKAYWQTNMKLVAGLLAIWFLVSYGCGILFVQQLNAVKLPFTEFPLGFWFAQQGAIYVFVILIWVYALAMDRIERHYGVAED
ncbi:MAG: DUF4212 domain-containing protein [Myxococcota bacterium]